jgi:hypothetical protein
VNEEHLCSAHAPARRGRFCGVKWLSILAVLLALGTGFASVFVIDGDEVNGPPSAHNVTLSVAKRWSLPGKSATARCRPSKDRSGYFDCTVTLAGHETDEAAISSYDLLVPAGDR